MTCGSVRARVFVSKLIFNELWSFLKKTVKKNFKKKLVFYDSAFKINGRALP